MKIVRNGFRLDFQNLLEMFDGVLKEIKSRCILQIANVLAEKDRLIARQSAGIFQLRSASQDAFARRLFQENRRRNISSGTTNDARFSLQSRDGIIAALQNLAVVQQKTIGNSTEPADS